MSDIVIRAEGLSKLYRIGERERYYTFRDTLANAFTAPFRWLRNGGHPTLDVSSWASASISQSAIRNSQSEYIWALKDVSFEIRQGEVVGVIGRNGAGKSTLLKILSRITEPTEGSAEIHGRVGSLLEVGTGFHPELTGRENIYLNGAILGMKRREIERKFDEIVAFAEVDKFIDTPVKHYSSGMYMRLAFAVAAHLEPEILLVDEVLAVGDAGFQKKCLGKIGEVAKEGRTVLFVSHNMAAIKSLCGYALLLDEGRLCHQGDVLQTVLTYLGARRMDPPIKHVSPEAHVGGISRIRLLRVELINAISGSFAVLWKQPMELCLEIRVSEPVADSCFGLGVVTLDGIPVLTVHHNDSGAAPWTLTPGYYRIQVLLENNLRAGTYCLSIGAHELVAKTPLFYVPEVIQFEVLDVHADSSINYVSHNSGLVNGTSQWQVPEPVHSLRKQLG